MTIAPAIVAGVIIFGAVVLAAGMIGLIRDGRRLATPVYVTMGLGLLAIGVGLLLTNQGHPGPLIVVGITAMALFILGNVVGYPLLMIFLLYSGATVLRKERRSLGNALALLAGLALLFLPTTLGILAPPETPRTDPAYMFRYATHLSVVLVVFYFGFVFAAFFAASLLYRWRRIRTAPESVIVLGSGLIDGNVPPLLAARLDRGLSVQQQFHGEPMLIPSGGQGADEPRPEGEAMRDYLVAQGADPATVTAETESRTTEENLRYSRKAALRPVLPGGRRHQQLPRLPGRAPHEDAGDARARRRHTHRLVLLPQRGAPRVRRGDPRPAPVHRPQHRRPHCLRHRLHRGHRAGDGARDGLGVPRVPCRIRPFRAYDRPNPARDAGTARHTRGAP